MIEFSLLLEPTNFTEAIENLRERQKLKDSGESTRFEAAVTHASFLEAEKDGLILPNSSSRIQLLLHSICRRGRKRTYGVAEVCFETRRQGGKRHRVW